MVIFIEKVMCSLLHGLNVCCVVECAERNLAADSILDAKGTEMVSLTTDHIVLIIVLTKLVNNRNLNVLVEHQF